MNVSCDIIRDILPLYAEDMVSEATKEFVDGHLCECDACTKELGSLKKPQKFPAEVDISALNRVKDSIRRRRILAVLAVFLFVTTVLIGGALLLDARIYLSANEAVEDIYVEGDAVKIVWSDQIIGSTARVDTEDPRNYAVTSWTNLYRILFRTERIPYEQLDDEFKARVTEEQYALFDNSSSFELENPAETNFLYVDPSEPSMTLILNADQPFPDEPLMDVYFNNAYYVAGLAVLCILCFLFSLLDRNRWYCELSGRLSILFGSLAISAVVVIAGQFASIMPEISETIVDSTAVAVPMCLCGLCIRQLIKLNRQDKGL